ncbi:hypothetical protein AMET1_1517 [Methanonatronarchaeum thermophilum]|uniref:Putative nickel insertion protein n=1 Tax=Methanonatronarchaeum thermophilum TaxID=1927129 RepID=A0A1Y3GF29_9EURY|nr:nickel pincer cofactor biosynthesis protein LarC [Methanonatronarchaeum thermophilum]OUJ18075.1 hypothetical protein AMET1_1517 [Methanonatronarchaeum thermophilum]
MKKNRDMAVFIPSSGAAGDMIVGSLLDAGANVDLVLGKMKEVGNKAGEINVNVSKTDRNSISGLRVEIDSTDSKLRFEDMVQIIQNSNLSRQSKNKSIQILKNLKEAEDKVHNSSSEFHEVGKADALADIVGSVVGYYDLKLDSRKIYCTELKVGGGYTKTQHGLLSAPTPATLNILKENDMKFSGGPVKQEILTPTGAAILSVFVDKYVETIPHIKITDIGRGAGKKELEVPNLLTICIGEGEKNLIEDTVTSFETNIDDVEGEEIGYLIDKLLKEGALDVSVIPALMKKGRIGNILKVISRKEDLENLSEIVIKETGTLGVRISRDKHRLIAERKFKIVEVFNEEVNVKIGKFRNGEIFDISPEYEDCVKIAEKTGTPLKEVKTRALLKAKEDIN